MTKRCSYASLTACLLAVGFLGLGPAVEPASAGKSAHKSRESARNYVLESRRRARAPVIFLPLGPAYTYYDYPYYYARGHYPTHIVRYVYYPAYPRYGGGCSYWGRTCVSKSGVRSQRGACRCP